MPSTEVYLQSVAQLRAKLAAYRAPLEFRRGRESLFVWRPLYEEMLNLLGETLEQDWPFQRFPPTWRERTEDCLHRLEETLEGEVLCHYPQRWDSDFGYLGSSLATAILDPSQLDGRSVGRCRSLWKQSVEDLGPLQSSERRRELARRRVGYEDRDDPEFWARQLAQDLKGFDPEGGLPSDFDLSSVPETFRELFRYSTKSCLEQLLEEQLIDSIPLLLSVMKAFRRGGSSTFLEEFVRLWWRYLPQQTLDPDLRQEINGLLEECSFDWMLPGRLREVSGAYLEISSREAEGRLATRYYLGGEGNFRERCEELRNDCDNLPRQWSLLDNFCCGGAFALASALRGPGEPGPSAESCLESCAATLGVAVKKPYKRLQQHKRAATSWQQALFFLSYCDHEQAFEILGRFLKSALRPHVEVVLCLLQSKGEPELRLTTWVEDPTSLSVARSRRH